MLGFLLGIPTQSLPTIIFTPMPCLRDGKNFISFSSSLFDDRTGFIICCSIYRVKYPVLHFDVRHLLTIYTFTQRIHVLANDFKSQPLEYRIIAGLLDC
jgi:hypothetical protein